MGGASRSETETGVSTVVMTYVTRQPRVTRFERRNAFLSVKRLLVRVVTTERENTDLY